MFDRFAVRLSTVVCLGLLSASVSFADLPAPVAMPVSVVTAENSAASITFIATDSTNGPFMYQVKTQPLHGHLSVVSGDRVTYTPDDRFVGDDAFTYSATDPAGESDAATVTIKVSAAPASVVSLPALSALALCILAALLAGVVLRNRAFV